MYHAFLRTSALTLALVLLFVSGIVSPVTKELSANAGSYVANAIGVKASVFPTELNTITAELTARERDLAAREAALSEREIAVDLTTSGEANNTAIYILSGILFILLVLILLNYVLDYLRRRDTSATVLPAS